MFQIWIYGTQDAVFQIWTYGTRDAAFQILIYGTRDGAFQIRIYGTWNAAFQIEHYPTRSVPICYIIELPLVVGYENNRTFWAASGKKEFHVQYARMYNVHILARRVAELNMLVFCDRSAACE